MTQFRTRPSRVPVAFVTGAASGIGRALALACARAGNTVVVADRQVGLAGKVVAEIEQAGGSARVAELDVRDRAHFAAVVDEVIREAGQIDYLFNNAGIGVVGHASQYSEADWHDVLDVNLRGVCNGIASVYPQMIKQRSGHIVNIASLAGLVPLPLAASYTASKFAVVGLSRALRIEAAPHGVRVTAVCPAIVDTPLLTGGRYSRFNDDAGFLQRGRGAMHFVAIRPDKLASRVLRDVERNRALVVYPGWARLLWGLDRLSPGLTARAIAALLKRMQR